MRLIRACYTPTHFFFLIFRNFAHEEFINAFYIVRSPVRVKCDRDVLYYM